MLNKIFDFLFPPPRDSFEVAVAKAQQRAEEGKRLAYWRGKLEQAKPGMPRRGAREMEIVAMMLRGAICLQIGWLIGWHCRGSRSKARG